MDQEEEQYVSLNYYKNMVYTLRIAAKKNSNPDLHQHRRNTFNIHAHCRDSRDWNPWSVGTQPAANTTRELEPRSADESKHTNFFFFKFGGGQPIHKYVPIHEGYNSDHKSKLHLYEPTRRLRSDIGRDELTNPPHMLYTDGRFIPPLRPSTHVI